jgi:uncharacterized protein
MNTRPPLPPFTEQTARQKVQAAQDARNTRDPHQVSLACAEDPAGRTRGTFVTGRGAIAEFLTQKRERELACALRKEPRASAGITSRCVSGTKVTTRPASGGAATAANGGSSTTTS